MRACKWMPVALHDEDAFDAVIDLWLRHEDHEPLDPTSSRRTILDLSWSFASWSFATRRLR